MDLELELSYDLFYLLHFPTVVLVLTVQSARENDESGA